MKKSYLSLCCVILGVFMGCSGTTENEEYLLHEEDDIPRKLTDAEISGLEQKLKKTIFPQEQGYSLSLFDSDNIEDGMEMIGSPLINQHGEEGRMAIYTNEYILNNTHTLRVATIHYREGTSPLSTSFVEVSAEVLRPD